MNTFQDSINYLEAQRVRVLHQFFGVEDPVDESEEDAEGETPNDDFGLTGDEVAMLESRPANGSEVAEQILEEMGREVPNTLQASDGATGSPGKLRPTIESVNRDIRRRIALGRYRQSHS